MYNNRDNLQVGKDYYDLATGEYVFTIIYDGDDDDRISVEGIPAEVKSDYGDYMLETWAYNKETLKVFNENDLCDIAYETVLVDKARMDVINTTKQVLMNLFEESGIQEPFVVENGNFYVGKEQVLSAHINAGYEHGWISSSICW